MSSFQFHVAVLSLLDADFNPLEDLIAAHLRWLYACGAQGILVLGTTGEFPNLPVPIRQRYLEAVLRCNPGLSVMVNVGASSMADVACLQSHALSKNGVQSLLWMPPFYYPSTGINGLEACLSQLLRHQPSETPLYLYHYPKHSQVPITADLLAAFPQVAGMKDSSGDFDRMQALTTQFPRMAIFSGTDSELIQAQQAGCVGVISGLANVCPQLFTAIINGDTGQQALLRAVRDAMTRFPKIPSMKAYLNSLRLSSQQAISTLPFRDLTASEAMPLLETVQALVNPEDIPRHATS